MIACFLLLGLTKVISSSSEFDFGFPTQHGLAIVKHLNSNQNYQLLNSMPASIHIQVDLLMDQEGPRTMHLFRNNVDTESKPVFAVKEDSDGGATIVKEHVAIEQNVGLYQSDDTMAAFTVFCEGLEYGLCKPRFLGSINFNGTDFDIKPNLELGSSGYVADDLYNVYPRKQHEGNGKNCLTGENQEVAAISTSFQRELIKPTDFEHFAMRNSFRYTQSSGHSSYEKRSSIDVNYQRRQPSGSANTFAVGLLIVVDEVIYQRFFARSRGYTRAQKEENTKAAIRQYYAHTVNAMDIRYRNIRHPVYEIRIVVTGYIMDDNHMVDIWNDPHEASVEDVMFKAIDWRKKMMSELPPHDHLMIFTGRDLYTKFTHDYSVTGFASLDSVCRQDSVSIIEDKGGFDCIITATHELGHSLGARHDGDRNICTPHDKYIMTSIGGDVTVRTRLNPFKFSECSKSYFLDRLQTLSNQGYNCLSIRKSYYDQREFAGLTNVATGQLFDPNKQCRMKLGDDSYYGWGGNLGAFGDICTHMACKSNRSSTSYNLYNAARGTSCGNKKWCIDGECVYDQEAPGKDDACIHGDSLRSFAAYHSCAHLVASDPSKCMDSYYRQFCCESCKHYGLSTFVLQGRNRNRLGANVLSIPITNHVHHVLPNTFSARGIHANVNPSGFSQHSRSNSVHPVFSASRFGNNLNFGDHSTRNQPNVESEYRVFEAPNNNNQLRVFETSNNNPSNSQYDNNYNIGHHSSQHQNQRQNTFQLQPNVQSSDSHVSATLPDHHGLNPSLSFSPHPQVPTMNTQSLTSFRNLLMRTLHLLTRTSIQSYDTAPTQIFNSYNQPEHNNYESQNFYHMRNMPRGIFENFGSDLSSDSPSSHSVSFSTTLPKTTHNTANSETTQETDPSTKTKPPPFNNNMVTTMAKTRKPMQNGINQSNTLSSADSGMVDNSFTSVIDPFLK